MISYDQAHRIAQEHISSWNRSDAKLSLVIVESATIERPWGWVFFYTSKLWLETKEDRYMLAGNAPFIVERNSGRIVVLGTARPTEHYLALYEKHGDPHFRQSPEIRLISAAANVDRIAAVKLVRDFCGVGLIEAKQQVEACCKGKKPCVTAPNVDGAEQLAQQLESLGFVVERLPSSSV